MSRDDVLQFVTTVKEMHEAVFHKSSGFHIGPCYRCGAPVWQQPCPVCGYYPGRGFDDPIPSAKDKEYYRCSFGRFEQIVSRNGNYAAWYFSGYRGTSGYRNKPGFALLVEKVVEEAEGLQCPTAEDIWEYVYPDTYKDSSGKPIMVGDPVIYRGRLYTISQFIPRGDDPAIVVFKEDQFTPEEVYATMVVGDGGN